MSSNKHNNYKAKWLSALKDNEKTPAQRLADQQKKLDAAASHTADATIALRRIHDPLVEAASRAKTVIECLDNFKDVAGHTFGEVGHIIDTKLGSMPAEVIARRLRDLFSIVELRIAMISITADENYKALNALSAAVDDHQRAQSPIQRTLVDTVFIGPRATSTELEDYTDAKGANYHRYGITYQPVDDEWLEQHLNGNTVLRTVSDASDADSDSEIDTPTATKIVVAKHRLAHVVPQDLNVS